MVTKRIIVVFVLPVIFSVLFGSFVLNDILERPDRELNMWPMSSHKSPSHNSSVEIIGMLKQYSTSQPVEVQVRINDRSFDCGDLYITIYSSENDDVVTQGGFFEQCFANDGSLLPVTDKFSKSISVPGSYNLVVEMMSKELKNISTSTIFTVK